MYIRCVVYSLCLHVDLRSLYTTYAFLCNFCIRSFYWVESAKYLGVYLVSSTKFKCSFSNNKARFFKAFNSIFGKIGGSASEEVVFELVESKCLPVLMYGLDVCRSNSADRHSLQFSVNKIIYTIFGAIAKDSYDQISEYFGIPSVEQLITNRHNRFLNRYRCQENDLCQALA